MGRTAVLLTLVTALALMWVAALLSALVDNIPFVATMIPMIQNMTELPGGAEGPCRPANSVMCSTQGKGWPLPDQFQWFRPAFAGGYSGS